LSELDSYTNHFVSSISDVPFSFCNGFYDQLWCFVIVFSSASVNRLKICVLILFQSNENSERNPYIAYANEFLSQMMTYRWLKCFENGRMSKDHNKHSAGRLQIQYLWLQRWKYYPRKSTVLNVADKVVIPTGSRHTIPTEETRMHHVSAKLVARILTDDIQNLLEKRAMLKIFFKISLLITGCRTCV
jgi:hypothetical protein